MTNKDGPKNKTDIVKPDKPDKAARPGGKLDLLADNDITLVSASIRPNNFSPKVRIQKEGKGGEGRREAGMEIEDQMAFLISLTLSDVDLMCTHPSTLIPMSILRYP